MMNTATENVILFHLPNGKILKFLPCTNEQNYSDPADPADPANPANHTIDGVTSSNNTISACLSTFLQSVEKNKFYFSHKEIDGANEARKLQQLIDWPNTTSFKHYTFNNMIHNTKVTVEDINRAEKIYGPGLPVLSGKIVRIKPVFDEKMPESILPLEIAENHRNVQLHVDFLFVKRRPYPHTKAEKINF